MKSTVERPDRLPRWQSRQGQLAGPFAVVSCDPIWSAEKQPVAQQKASADANLGLSQISEHRPYGESRFNRNGRCRRLCMKPCSRRLSSTAEVRLY